MSDKILKVSVANASTVELDPVRMLESMRATAEQIREARRGLDELPELRSSPLVETGFAWFIPAGSAALPVDSQGYRFGLWLLSQQDYNRFFNRGALP